MPFKIVRDDITRMPVGAIVNAANARLEMGGGVCGAIFAAAGQELMRAECDRIGGCSTGEAVITAGCRLPARHVIHAVGPVWQGGGHGEEELLRSCYRNALALAVRHRLTSIAFPLISSGIYGYPKDRALRVAVSEIGRFLQEHELDVSLVVFDRAAFRISEELFSAVERFVDDHYVEEAEALHARRALPQPMQGAVPPDKAAAFQAPQALPPKALRASLSLQNLLDRMDLPFSQALLMLIDRKGMTDVEVYKRANIDRKLFSKIRSQPAYNPSKQTAIALAIALRLNLEETRDLLGRAGYALSPSSKFDLIIEYFIRKGVYDIHQINETLFAFDQSLLGA